MDAILRQVGKIFLPGDVIGQSSEFVEDEESLIKFGPGLRHSGNTIIAYKYGVLKTKEKPLSFWIDTNQKCYIASKNDTVIGIIINRGSESYKVDIGTSQQANLSTLAFEGATKRHKPNLQINDLVLAKLSVANKDMEPELTCVDAISNKNNNLGQLSGGYMFSTSLGLSRKLLSIPECKVLNLLSKHFPFELAVGMNGRVWIHSKGIIDTIAIMNAIVSSEFMDDTQITLMVKQLIDSISGFEDDMTE